MSSAESLHAVLGGTGGVGGAIVAALRERGTPVRSIARHHASTPPGVEAVAADLFDPRSLVSALEGASFVFHAAQPAYTRWPQDLLRMTEAVVDATSRAGADLVVVDNLYAYGPRPGGYGPGTPAGPMTESTSELATGSKGRARRAATKALLQAHLDGRLRVAVGRASNYYGPHGLASAVGEQVFGAALRGKPVRWLSRVDQPRTLHYLPDIAAALLRLAQAPGGYGRVWHLPAAPAMTGQEFLDIVADTIGHPLRVKRTSAAAVRTAGLVSPAIRETTEIMYQWDRPFVSDDSAFTSSFGRGPVTPPQVAVAETVEWFRDRASRAES